jgi:D-lactate dehydrogenase (cytochrome)
MTRMEFLDPAAIAACNRFSDMQLPEQPTLFLEFSGSTAEIDHQIELVKSIGGDLGGGDFSHADTAEARNILWRARHQALPAARALRANTVAWITDICVPISHLADAIKQAQDGIAAAGLTAPILGHVGDGNFHVFFILDPDNAEEWAKAKHVNEGMIAHALSVGGTCTGEHGIGLGKREALLREHGSDAVAAMHSIKRALDPHNLMNPGKIFI